MTKATLLATVLCAAIATQASARFSANHVELTGSTAQDLQGDTIYDVSENRTITAEAGKSAFRVADNRVVAINIKKGVTLTLKGGDATGSTGAGAAICVLPGSTLYLMGEGTLVATGGAAANGGAGGKGGNGNVIDGV